MCEPLSRASFERHRTFAFRVARAAPELRACVFALLGSAQSHELSAQRALRKRLIRPIRPIFLALRDPRRCELLGEAAGFDEGLL